jgi:hypothetical protein
MSILTAEKIFVDQKEEITFIIDRVLASTKNKVIFIVPQGALLLSSPISTKILFKEVSKLKKSAIVVTEDAFGVNLAERVGFIVVSKVSQITGESWQFAKSRMENFLDKIELKKTELSTQLNNDELQITNEESTLEDTDVLENQREELIDELKEEGRKKNEELLVNEEGANEPANELTSELENNEKESIIENEETEALKNYAKPRADAKIVELDGIEIFAGGDIKKLRKENVQYDKIQDDNFVEANMSEISPTDRIRNISSTGKFTGKDFTKVVQKQDGISAFFSNLFRKKRSLQEDSPEFSLARAKRNKIIAVIATVIGIALLIFGYLVAYEFSSVDVRLNFKTEEIPVIATVLANPNITEVDTGSDPIAVPAVVLSVEKVNASWTGTANGEGKKGQKAKGFLTIYNLKTQAVTLPVGTKATSVATGKVYVLTAAAELEPASVSPSGVIDADFVEDVPIEAIDLGAEYNVDSNDSNSSFTIEGYQLEEVRARRFQEIEGGSSTPITTVSQANFDQLKAEKLKELKAQAENKLRTLIPVGSVLIPETIVYTETSAVSVPKVNEESTDKTFALTVELTVTGYSVKSDDLKEAGEFFLTSDQDTDENSTVVVGDLTTPQVTKVEKNEAGGYLLSISSKGSVGSQPTEEEIRNNIQGKSIDEATKYFQGLKKDDILEDFKINFNPGIVPGFLRKVPSVNSRVNIKIQ